MAKQPSFIITDDLIARWESGKRWVNLYQDSGGCFWKTNEFPIQHHGNGGNLGQVGSEQAIKTIEMCITSLMQDVTLDRVKRVF